jgi:hypothetical protein
MAEVRDDEGRVDLYRKLLNDPATRTATARLSYKQWESKLLNDDNVLQKVADYATKKNWALDQDEFLYKYAPEKVARAPKPQAAPKQQAVAPPVIEEEEAYIPEPQPAVGSREYDAQLQTQYGGMAPTLGATFGGAPAVFETKEQKKQEQISPVFKAQQLAFEDAPIAEEQRRSQREFAKATKEQQQAAIRGGTGFEYQQRQANKERGIGDKTGDLLGAVAAGGKRIGEGILSSLEYYVNGTLRAGLPEIEATDSVQELARNEMYKNATQAQNAFQDEVAKRNIQTSVLTAIDKGEYNRIPEATLYTVGDAAMQIIPAILTMGGSTYLQTLPEAYKNGVEAIAKEKGITPEQVVASGDDAMLTAQISSGVQSALESLGAGLVSKSIASRGGYKVIRDFLIKNGGSRTLARAAGLSGVALGEGITEYLQEGTAQIGESAAKSTSVAKFLDKLPEELFTPEAKRRRQESFVGGVIGGGALGGGGQLAQSAMDRTLFEAPKIGKATQRVDYNIVQTDDKIQQRNKMLQAMESAIQANPEAEGQIRERYRKLTDALELTDQEVLDAYDGIAQLPPSPEKDRIIQGLEEYMAEKGIQPQATGVEAGLGEGLRAVAPEETITAPPIITQPPVEPVEPITTEEETTEALTEEPSLEESLLGIVPQEPVTEEAPVEEVAPEEEVVAEEEIPQPKAGDFVIVNGEKGVVVVTPGGQMSVETDTKIYDLDERGIAGIGGRLVAPKEKTQTEYEVEVIDDDNALVNGEPFQIIRDEKGNTIALQGQTRTIRTEPVMVDVDIKRNKAQVKETPQQQAEEVESLSPDMTLDKQGFVDDIIGQNMTEGVDRILSDGVTEKTQERDLLQFKLFVEATIADLRARQKGNPYADAMIEQLQEALNTVYYEYYSQGRKAEARTSKTEKKTNRGTKGKERVAPKPAEGKQPVAKQPEAKQPAAPKPAPVVPPAPKAQPAAEKKEEKPAPKAEPKEEKPTTGMPEEGSKVNLPPQSKYTTEPRRMVFKDGEWKQEVGGQITSVGESVQQQAQEAFSGKTEAKAEETKPTAESFANDLEKALNAMKVKVGKGAALEGTFMIPVLVYNGAIDAAILAVKAGKTVVDAINVAVKYVNDNLKGDWDNGGFIGKLSVDLTKPMESYEDYKRVKGKGKEPSPGQKVGVRFNLNIYDYGRRNVLSVHEKNYNGEVIDIVKSSTVSDVKFSASKSGASKIKEGLSNKFPIASVDGNFVSSDADKTLTESGQRVFFNPRVADFFYDKDGREVLSASKATLDGSKVFADGLEYGERVAPINQQPATTTTQAEFTSKQESSASTEFDGMKKPSKIKTKSFDNKHGKGAFDRMQNITQNFEDIMDGLSEKIKQDCL